MVQMKDAKRKSQYSVICKLYIPHGSDESFKNMKCKNRHNVFISHMVQMKGTQVDYDPNSAQDFISHMVQMKVCFVSTNSSENLPFISHMVQMKEKVEKQNKSDKILSLYPTWFR